MNIRPIATAFVLMSSLWLTSATARSALAGGPPFKLPKTVEFNRDVRPILADNCFACHGPDKNKRKADLRLDTQEGLLGKAGHTGVVVPSKPDDSELLRRICSKDADERMPPAQFGKVLSDSDRQLFRRWIEQGAKWEGHWAFLPISRPKPPAVKPGRVAKNDVDRFILQALDEHGLQPSPEADPRHAVASAAVRFDRIAAIDRGGRCVRRRSERKGLRKGCRPSARLAPIRRADGDVVARPRPLCRQRRLSRRPAGQRLSFPRLRHQVVQ